MLSERLLRTSPDRVRAGLVRRNAGPETLAALDGWLALDAERRALATEYDVQAARGRQEKRGCDSSSRKELRAQLAALEDEQRALLARIPNLPRDDVPDGQDASANIELQRWGTPPAFDFAPRRHDELATARDS